jgi:hypothetical protein
MNDEGVFNFVEYLFFLRSIKSIICYILPRNFFNAFVNISPAYGELAHVYWFLHWHILSHLICPVNLYCLRKIQMRGHQDELNLQ